MGRDESGFDRLETTRNERRQFRLVPPAITPLGAADIAAGLVDHLVGHGRERFRREVESRLDAVSSATYTSFRRSLAGCFSELASHADGNEVLIPAFCSSDFPDAIEGVGLSPIRYDVDPATLAADVDSLERRLDEDTVAVVAVNVLGYSSPMDELQTRCADREVVLVEALGYAFGAEYQGRPLGTFGDCAVLNFQQGKPIPIGGGMVVSRDPALEFGERDRPAVGTNVGALAGYAVLSRPRGYFAYTWLRDRLAGLGIQTERPTTHPESKFDVEYGTPLATMSDFQGRIGFRILQRLDVHRRQRARTAAFYESELASCPRLSVVDGVTGLTGHQHVRFPLLADSEALRDRIQTELLDAGIQATTLYDWPVIDARTYPGAASLQRRIVTVPTHPYVDERDRRRVVDVVRGVVTAESKDRVDSRLLR